MGADGRIETGRVVSGDAREISLQAKVG